MRHLLILIACLSANYIFAQDAPPKDNAPLTHIGLGEIVEQNLSGSVGMSGLSATYRDAYHINILNPASLAALKSTAYELGFFVRSTTNTTPTTATKATSGNLQYMVLGFPLKNQVNELLDKREKSPWNYGMQLSVAPYSKVGYDVTNTKTDPTLGTTTYNYKGRGGAYKFEWGTGASYKGFAAGVTVGYLFGNISASGTTILDNSVVPNGYQNSYQTNYDLRGFIWNAGIQYDYAFKKLDDKKRKVDNGKHIIVGAYGNPATTFRSYTSELITHVNPYYITNASGAYAIDTFRNIVGARKNGVLPGEAAFGIMYEETDKWRIGINYVANNWNKYTNEARPGETLKASNKLSIGAEYVPNAGSFGSYWNRVRYQAGFYTGKDPRTFNGNQLKRQGFTLGLGMPLRLPRNQISFMQVTFESGKYSIPTFTARYYQVSFGFTLNDNGWFYKRRFD